jgi:hypothetical protein
MSQADIDRAVARATGESRDIIEHMGFGLLRLVPPPSPRAGRRRRRRYRHALKTKPVAIGSAA